LTFPEPRSPVAFLLVFFFLFSLPFATFSFFCFFGGSEIEYIFQLKLLCSLFIAQNKQIRFGNRSLAHPLRQLLGFM
jgi:hypothetical protein